MLISMESRLGRHALFWLLLPVLLVLAAPAVPQLGLYRVSQAEIEGNRRLLGEAAEAQAEARAAKLWSHWFVDSGLVRWTFNTFARRYEGPNTVSSWRDLARGYLQRLWWTVYKACYRFEVALAWFAAAGIVLAAAFADGAMRRLIKSCEFGYANPVAFSMTAYGLMSVGGLLLAMPFAPFAIQQWVWPCVIAAAAGLAWKAAESYQTAL